MAALRLATHLFGSSGGYRTIASSADLTLSERRELESFGFGETADRAVLAGLAERPSALGRPLPGGRIAITRIVEGPLDEAQRPTLELRTIVATPPEMLEIAAFGVERLLGMAPLWSSTLFRSGGEIEVALPPGPDRPAPGGAAILPMLEAYEAWALAGAARQAGETVPVLVLEPEEVGSAALSALLGSLAPEDLWSIRWGVRVLGVGGALDLRTLAPGVRASGDRPLRRWRIGEGLRTPALVERLREFQPGLTLPPRRIVMLKGEAAEPVADAAPSRRASAAALAAAAVLLVLAAVLWQLFMAPPPASPTLVAQAPEAPAAAEAVGGADAGERLPAPPVLEGRTDQVAPTEPPTPMETALPPQPPPLPVALPEPIPVEIDPLPPVAAPPQRDGDGGAEPSDLEDPRPRPDQAVPDEASPAPPEPVLPEPVPPDSPTEPAPPEPDPCADAEQVERLVLRRLRELEPLLSWSPVPWERVDAQLGEIVAALESLPLADLDESTRRSVLSLGRDRRGGARDLVRSQWPLVRAHLCGWQAWVATMDEIEAIAARASMRASAQSFRRLRRGNLWVVPTGPVTGAALQQRWQEVSAGLLRQLNALPPLEAQPNPAAQRWLEAASTGRLEAADRFAPPRQAVRGPIGAAVSAPASPAGSPEDRPEETPTDPEGPTGNQRSPVDPGDSGPNRR